MRLAVALILLAFCSANICAQDHERGRTTHTWRQRAKVYEPFIASSAQRYNIDPYLLWTIAYLESRFRKDAVSYKDGKPCGYGIMQFTVSTARRYGLNNPLDPRESIDAAARYVRDLQTRFGPRVDLILAAYNAGEGTVEAFRDGKILMLPNNKIINPRRLRTGGIPPYNETRRYVSQGAIIYGTITRRAIPATRFDESSYNRTSNAIPVNTDRRNSLYFLDGIRNASSEHSVKPTKPNRNTSIYVN
ncbi:MAG TPA: lytic transglycosylase domain-containing protein [Pyrinomonadaceae bacterium]|nr:lytic transglycosylase domain-containing protein [Pyrinomonadaceae bacterium]